MVSASTMNLPGTKALRLYLNRMAIGTSRLTATKTVAGPINSEAVRPRCACADEGVMLRL